MGEVVGTESKGLSAATIASLPSVTYQAQDKHEGNMEQYGLCFLMPYPLTEKVLSVLNDIPIDLISSADVLFAAWSLMKAKHWLHFLANIHTILSA